jgi:hypothetical protein
MKTRIRSAAVAALIVVGALAAPAAAQAHYDPWNTHWHYSDGAATYKMCGWWDATFGGCQDENRFGTIVLR